MDYTDLAVYDASVVDLTTKALAAVTAKFPDFAPVEGSLEVVLLEAFAQITVEAVYAANRAPAIVMQSLLELYGLIRDAGEFPTVQVTFTLADNGTTRTVPVGTRLLVTSGDGSRTVVFATNAQLNLDAGATSGTVLAAGTERTDDLNGVTGLTIAMLDSVAYVDRVELAGTVTTGRDPEALSAYLNRGTTLLSRLTSTLVRADQFATAAMDNTAVARAVALDLYNPAATPPDNQPGNVTVAVLGHNGALLTADQKSTIEADLEAKAVAMLDVHVIDATVTAVNVTVDVEPIPGWIPADVAASVRATLDAYLNPATWAFGSTVYRLELVSVIDQAPGVQRVISLTTPSGDTTLTGVGPLADLGTLTVTVNGATP